MVPKRSNPEGRRVGDAAELKFLQPPRCRRRRLRRAWRLRSRIRPEPEFEVSSICGKYKGRRLWENIRKAGKHEHPHEKETSRRAQLQDLKKREGQQVWGKEARQEQEVEEDFQQKIDRQKMTARQPRASEPHRHHGAAGGKCGSNSLRSSRTQNSTIPKMKSKNCEEQQNRREDAQRLPQLFRQEAAPRGAAGHPDRGREVVENWANWTKEGN